MAARTAVVTTNLSTQPSDIHNLCCCVYDVLCKWKDQVRLQQKAAGASELTCDECQAIETILEGYMNVTTDVV